MAVTNGVTYAGPGWSVPAELWPAAVTQRRRPNWRRPMSEQRAINQTEHHDDKGPRAFPISADEFFDRGMTLRDYFAAMAMQGFCSNPTWLKNVREGFDESVAVSVAIGAYEQADAMLAARKK